MFNIRIVISCFILALIFCPGAEAKLFKWIDEHGNTHYGESIPPEYAAKEKDLPSNSGKKSRNIEIMSPEIIQEKKEVAARKEAARKEMEEKKRHDIMLLNTYSSEEEIDLARDRSVALVNARIESIDILLKSSQNTLNELRKEANLLGMEGKQIPPSLYDDISLAEEKVSGYRLERSRSEEQLLSVISRFDNDKIQYRKILVENAVNNTGKIGVDCPGAYNSSDSDDSSYKYKKRSRRRY